MNRELKHLIEIFSTVNTQIGDQLTAYEKLLNQMKIDTGSNLETMQEWIDQIRNDLSNLKSSFSKEEGYLETLTKQSLLISEFHKSREKQQKRAEALVNPKPKLPKTPKEVEKSKP